MPLLDAEAAYLRSLAGASPRTAATYRSALNRFHEYLVARGQEPETLCTDAFSYDVLERYYVWLVRTYGRDDRFTVATYVAGVRAFFRFLARRRLLAADLSFEELRDNLREVMGRVPYKTPRIDQRLVLIVTRLDGLELPADDGVTGQARLELLRDRALVRTLFATGIRRE